MLLLANYPKSISTVAHEAYNYVTQNELSAETTLSSKAISEWLRISLNNLANSNRFDEQQQETFQRFLRCFECDNIDDAVGFAAALETVHRDNQANETVAFASLFSSVRDILSAVLSSSSIVKEGIDGLSTFAYLCSFGEDKDIAEGILSVLNSRDLKDDDLLIINEAFGYFFGCLLGYLHLTRTEIQ